MQKIFEILKFNIKSKKLLTLLNLLEKIKKTLLNLKIREKFS